MRYAVAMTKDRRAAVVIEIRPLEPHGHANALATGMLLRQLGTIEPVDHAVVCAPTSAEARSCALGS
jgi:hypothetical protein